LQSYRVASSKRTNTKLSKISVVWRTRKFVLDRGKKLFCILLLQKSVNNASNSKTLEMVIFLFRMLKSFRVVHILKTLRRKVFIFILKTFRRRVFEAKERKKRFFCRCQEQIRGFFNWRKCFTVHIVYM
jgi:hypothetical protein